MTLRIFGAGAMVLAVVCLSPLGSAAQTDDASDLPLGTPPAHVPGNCSTSAATGIRAPSDAEDVAVWSSLSPGIQEALTRDLGLTAKNYAREMRVEQLAEGQQAKAKAQLGINYGGFWLEQDDCTGASKPVAASTYAGAITKMSSWGGEVRQVKYSVAVLERTMSQLNDTVIEDASIHSWWIDLSENVVKMSIDPGPQAAKVAARMIIASDADPGTVKITTSAGRPTPFADAVHIDAGQGITVGRGNALSVVERCTMGFGFAWEHKWGFLTAGHCGPRNYVVKLDDGSLLKPKMGEVYSRVFGREGDYALVETGDFKPDAEGNSPGSKFHPTGWVKTGLMKDGHEDNWTVTAWRETPLVRLSICQFGATTRQHQCGRIISQNATLHYKDKDTGKTIIIPGLAKTSSCGAKGDSGGPVFKQVHDHEAAAVGLISGGEGENTCLLPPKDPGRSTYFQPIKTVLDHFGFGGDAGLVRGSLDGAPWMLQVDHHWCLDIAYGQPGNGTEVQLKGCRDNDQHQNWTLTREGGLQGSGRCIDVPGGTSKLNTKVQLYDCNFTGGQVWVPRIERKAESEQIYRTVVTIRNPRSKLCLDVQGGSFRAEAPIIVWICTGRLNQRWSKAHY